MPQQRRFLGVPRFKGRNELVTGSSRGIGRGIALKLAEDGTRVAIHDYRTRDAALAALQKIRELETEGFVVQADVCQPDEVRRIFQKVRSEFGALDIFVRNARTKAPTFYEPRWRSCWRSGIPRWIRRLRHFSSEYGKPFL